MALGNRGPGTLPVTHAREEKPKSQNAYPVFLGNLVNSRTTELTRRLGWKTHPAS